MHQPFAHLTARLASESQVGAVEVAIQAADILLEEAHTGITQTPDEFRKQMLGIGRALIQAQPMVAPIINMVNRVLWAIDEAPSEDELSVEAARVIEDYRRQLRQHALTVAEEALTLIADGSTIVTISYSTTIQYALRHAQRSRRRFRVICAESRPTMEGRRTAAELARYGIPATLMADTAATAAVERAHLVLVGADMLSTRGLINKVGTHGLACVAQSCRVPFYSLCGSDKFLLNGLRLPEQPMVQQQDLWPDAPPQVAIEHWPYDVTSLEFVSSIITEHGPLPVAAIEAWLAASKLHPLLAETS